MAVENYVFYWKLRADEKMEGYEEAKRWMGYERENIR